MRVAITGGTGFVGRHLARSLVSCGHEVALIARGEDHRDPGILQLSGVRFFRSDLSDVSELARAFAACGAVAHCAGINREIGKQTYERVHVDGTRHVVEAARRAGVAKIALLSFLRARPDLSEWTWAGAKTAAGGALVWGAVPRLPAARPLLAGWTGMVGIILILHKGSPF